MRVPLVDLAAQEATVADDAIARILAVARAGKFVLGAPVEQFERWLADFCGASEAVGVASGTDAIELSLRALDVGPGDAVITPAFSFVAAAEAIAATGARPLFCDIDAETMNANVLTAANALRRGRRAGLRVRALVPVHLFGRCAPHALRAFALEEGLALVEDCAQALGARDDAGIPAGGAGDAGTLSFFPTKALGAWGDGGAVVTSRVEVAARVRRLRAHGAVEPYVHGETGRNSRLDTVQAAILLSKTAHLAHWSEARARIAERYRTDLAGLPIGLPAPVDHPAVHAWHAFVIRAAQRDDLARHLAARGIETRAYYPVPLHRQPCFSFLDEPSLPVAEEACRSALALPMFVTLSPEQQATVIDEIRRFFTDLGRS
ncbi:MAG TPA: DegT/DnrJ/EryC1/StrS family aminotransferase [Polyangiaceae bacterium]|nr:DegT/DnrJ/EryC1/StrS family aminotransferase [Polyangiaceae bacterium]